MTYTGEGISSGNCTGSGLTEAEGITRDMSGYCERNIKDLKKRDSKPILGYITGRRVNAYNQRTYKNVPAKRCA